MSTGISLDMATSLDVDDIIYENLRELEFIFTREFLAWFMGVEVTQYLQRRAQQRFNQEGNLAGEKGWRPLTEFTREERRSLGFGGAHPINKRTGQLEDWVTGANPSVIGDESAMELQWPGEMPESDLLREKYTTAQAGKSKNKNGKFVPARPVVRFSEVDFAHLMSRWAMQFKPTGVRFDGN